MLPVLGSGGGTLPLQRNHFMPVGQSWAGGDQGNCIKCARIVMMISVKSARLHAYSDDDDDVDWGGGSHKRQETCCWICAVSRWDFLPQTIQDFFSAARKRCSRGSSRSSKCLYSSSEKESQDYGSPHH